MVKLKWKVDEKPTGRYRSFVKRHWPKAHLGHRSAFWIVCSESYVPSIARLGPHMPLRLRAAIAQPDGRWDWRPLKGEFATLSEAKAHAQKMLDKHPEWFK